jgi:hypothetical protein
VLRKFAKWNDREEFCLSLFGSSLTGLKYFALNKFSEVEWLRRKLFEQREFFLRNGT